MTEDNPMAEYEQRDVYHDRNEEDVLYDAYLILYDYGYTHDDLAPLRHLITTTTVYDGYSVVQMAERIE